MKGRILRRLKRIGICIEEVEKGYIIRDRNMLYLVNKVLIRRDYIELYYNEIKQCSINLW
jgi:hypothetical protein